MFVQYTFAVLMNTIHHDIIKVHAVKRLILHSHFTDRGASVLQLQLQAYGVAYLQLYHDYSYSVSYIASKYGIRVQQLQFDNIAQQELNGNSFKSGGRSVSRLCEPIITSGVASTHFACTAHAPFCQALGNFCTLLP